MLINYVRTAFALKAETLGMRALKLDKRAVTAIEYGLIAALIAVVIIGALTTLGGGLKSTFGSVSSELT
jgi:pilus assembly protein Flp/PilA